METFFSHQDGEINTKEGCSLCGNRIWDCAALVLGIKDPTGPFYGDLSPKGTGDGSFCISSSATRNHSAVIFLIHPFKCQGSGASISWFRKDHCFEEEVVLLLEEILSAHISQPNLIFWQFASCPSGMARRPY